MKPNMEGGQTLENESEISAVAAALYASGETELAEGLYPRADNARVDKFCSRHPDLKVLWEHESKFPSSVLATLTKTAISLDAFDGIKYNIGLDLNPEETTTTIAGLRKAVARETEIGQENTTNAQAMLNQFDGVKPTPKRRSFRKPQY